MFLPMTSEITSLLFMLFFIITASDWLNMTLAILGQSEAGYGNETHEKLLFIFGLSEKQSSIEIELSLNSEP